MARARSNGGAYAWALVVLGCGFVVTLLVAIIFYTKIKQAEQDAVEAESELAAYVNLGQDGPALANWVERDDPDTRGMSAFRVMAEELAHKEDVIAARDIELATRQAAQAEAEATIARERETIAAREAELARQKAQADGTMQELQDRARQIEQQLASVSAERDQIQQTLQSTMRDANASAQTQIDALNDQLEDLEAEYSGVLANAKEQADYIAYLEDQLRDDIDVPQVARADGEILSVFNNGRQLFINRGRRQGIMLGMTFEVFDASDVIRLSDQGGLRGKATIEVYDIQDDTATCRVVRSTRGGQVTAADAIVNLVYDPNKVFTFFVYGDFDIEFDGGENDISRIKGLVTEWGAELAELRLDEEGLPMLSPSIDFIVLGRQPEFPEEPGDENFDPEVIQAWQAKVREYEIYQAVLDDAKLLRIPVLNQNRFIDLVGYYER